MNSPRIQEGMNLFRIYVDDDDRIIKCDYIENYDQVKYYDFKLSQKTLWDELKKFMNNPRIYHQEVIKDNYIIYKFYDVDVEEMDNLIRLNNLVSKGKPTRVTTQTKFRSNVQERTRQPQRQEPERPVYKPQNSKKKRKVQRTNKFDEKTVKIARDALILLLITAVGITAVAKLLGGGGGEITLPPEEPTSITRDVSEYETENSTELTFPKTEIQTMSAQDEADQRLAILTTDWTTTSKYTKCKKEYYDVIYQYAVRYGIDPELALAIACQERGEHTTEVDPGGGLGLYQIQVEGGWNWDQREVSTYNFETQGWETIKVDKEKARDVEYNTMYAMAILQDALRREGYDIAKGLQEYNFGPTGIKEAINKCCEQEGFDKSHFDDPDNLEWIRYRDSKWGDPEYLEHVLRYCVPGSRLSFTTPKGLEVTADYSNEQSFALN